MPTSPSPLIIRQYTGLQAYEPVWRAMQAFTDGRDEHTPDELWLLQHESVYTLGQAGKREHLLHAGEIPVVPVDRGGQITYHGPGQLVAYPLLDIRRLGIGVRELVTRIEQIIIDLCAGYGVQADRLAGAPGVYVDGAKIAALGLRVHHGRSFHGLAFNIRMDLSPFHGINPCGYAGMAITQLSDISDTQDIALVARDLAEKLAETFGLMPQYASCPAWGTFLDDNADA